MSKKKKKKRKDDQRVVAPRASPEKGEVFDQVTEDSPMDFGGLPDRDLKKNLGGCG